MTSARSPVVPMTFVANVGRAQLRAISFESLPVPAPGRVYSPIQNSSLRTAAHSNSQSELIHRRIGARNAGAKLVNESRCVLSALEIGGGQVGDIGNVRADLVNGGGLLG